LKAVFSHTIKQFRSIRTGDYILPDEGLVSFLRRINNQNSLDILTPSQNGSTIFWKSKDCEYADFNTLSYEQKENVIKTFNSFRNEVLEQAEKVLLQEFTSLKLEQNAKSFSELLKKTVVFQNIKLFYSEEKDRIGLIFGFVFSDQEVVDFGNQYLVSEHPEVNNGQEVTNVTEPIVDTNPMVHSIEDYSPFTPLPVPVRRQNHPWWINTIRGINWFAWRYWWLVWLIFLLSLLLLYLFCPCKKTSQNQSCDQLHHIHKNIDTLNSGLLFCCDCKRSFPPVQNDSIPKLDSNEIFLPADFILITYQFDPSGGRDLDTRTNIESPNQSAILGFCKQRSAQNIVWSGDNTGYGVESVYIDLNQYGSNDLIKVLCKAFWYSQRNSGNMSLDIRAYKGGTMQRDRSNHFQFINVGGEQVGNVISFPKNISMKGAKCMTGETIGTVKYNRGNQSLSFE
jgi:hypothetical protein